MSTLGQLLRDLPAQREILRYAGNGMTAQQLRERSARVAAGLRSLGVVRGDRVALWLPNVPAWLEAFFACARLGAIAVSVNTRFRAHEVADIVARSSPRVLIVWPDFRGIDFRAILAAIEPRALHGLQHIVVYDEAGAPCPAAIHGLPATAWRAWDEGADEVVDDGAGDDGAGADRCVIFTTSGTTRAPKFVCHVQATVVRHAREVAAALALDAPDARVLQALPMCGVFGFTQAMAALAGGAAMEVMPVFDAQAAAALIRERCITHCHGVDDMIASMLDVVTEPRPFPSLRHFGYAAFNPALDDIAVRAARRGLSVCGLYGMSECHALFAMQPRDLDVNERRKGGGRVISPTARVRVRDPDSGALLAPGQRGELEISGPSLMLEYYGDADATRAAFSADGYLRTGDLGYLEEDGRFCYCARMGDVMRLGGFLTSPLEIEAVLEQHPTVGASQVVAVEVNGRVSAVAFVVPAAEAVVVEAALIEFCRAGLAAYKVPARVFVVTEFPTTASANGTKIQKSRLRALAAQRLKESTTAGL